MGDPLVLIHNVYPGASHEEYERNIGELSRHFTVYAPDLLGFGASDAPRIKYNAQTYIELIFDFLREVVAQPASVVASGLTCAYVTEVAAWLKEPVRQAHLHLPAQRADGPGFAAMVCAHPPLLPEHAAAGQRLLRDDRQRARTATLSPRVLPQRPRRHGRTGAATGGERGPAWLNLCLCQPDHRVSGLVAAGLAATRPRVPILLIWGRQGRVPRPSSTACAWSLLPVAVGWRSSRMPARGCMTSSRPKLTVSSSTGAQAPCHSTRPRARFRPRRPQAAT